MFSILNRGLSWAITSFGNKFCLKKRTRLIKALENKFYVKFMQLEIGLLSEKFNGGFTQRFGLLPMFLLLQNHKLTVFSFPKGHYPHFFDILYFGVNFIQ